MTTRDKTVDRGARPATLRRRDRRVPPNASGHAVAASLVVAKVKGITVR